MADEEEIILSGWLRRKTSNLGWRKRWFLVTNSKIAYYKDTSLRDGRSFWLYDNFSKADVEIVDKTSFIVHLPRNQSRINLHVRAVCDTQAAEWVTTIQNVLTGCRIGRRHPYVSPKTFVVNSSESTPSEGNHQTEALALDRSSDGRCENPMNGDPADPDFRAWLQLVHMSGSQFGHPVARHPTKESTDRQSRSESL
ncbi:hypothetical protein GUITHDRAFT_108967 [Guillardia theta CCMP2712]|uniref:PH domain-containing protein n=1 Tax=Guillardia theta (strain CCMP2712) TaxID=905079 RepID=L1JB49_GUITC|nr:hypothetical protein GUITHDRAFT_108967 [Guillardia theta CCMP2712]EKX45329.1 hypothetical protein GUITHDRAFT_108967 [Guillardia theta CCMP2712]|mmetsp:Transcript_51372/g.160376  ORF Transcript_51372/g.160376 Transcript_51372/m.160376 type:complete len:197 (-) Transcript_51372:920-1510(-)|eukprot:XP_005832309.1 hypothetical protein GUITHDRAFT_108967 [Guillardia theta CCMP2712]